MDNVGLNSCNCILVTSGNISVKKRPCGSISFTCAQMLHIQVRFAQRQFASFGHLFFSDRFFDSAPSPIVSASSFLSIPSSLTPSSSLLSSFWLWFLLSLWLLWAEWFLQLEVWSMPLGLLWWAVSPFKQYWVKEERKGFEPGISKLFVHPILPYAREGSTIGVGHHAKPSPLVFHMISFVGGTISPRVNTKSMELAFHKLRKIHNKCKEDIPTWPL